jgi:signal peptidase I
MVDVQIIGLVKSRVDSTGYIYLPASGNSMYPLIMKGDYCQFIDISASQLTRGDIVLYHSLTGLLVAHRLFSTKELNGKRVFIFKGDTNLGMDKPVEESQIIGLLASIKRGDKTIHMGGIFVRIWSSLILTLPILPGLLRGYINKKNI